MDSEKKTLPNSYNSYPEPIVIQESQKPDACSSNKRYMIGAVVVVLVLLITVGAVLGALKLSHEYTKDTIKEFRLGNAVMKVDKDNDMVEMEDQKQGYHAYNDFTKGLNMMKVVDGDSYVCYPNPLRREALTPEAMESYMEHHPDGGDLMKHDRYANLPKYTPAKEPISDRRFLSQHLREACEGYPMHWLIPLPDQTAKPHKSTKFNSSDAVGRQKRDGEQEDCPWFCIICPVYC